MKYEKDTTLNIITFITVLLFIYCTILTVVLLYTVDKLNPNNTEVYLVVIEKHIPEVTKIPEKPKVEAEPVVAKHDEADKEINDPPEQPKKETKKIDNDTYLLAQIISAEAKGEPYKGMLAVGNVVLNRVKSSKFPNTIRGVIFQKGQFSPVKNGSINNKPSAKALEAAKEVMDGKRVVDDNAIFFYNPHTSTSSWIFSREVSTTIGNHAFAF